MALKISMDTLKKRILFVLLFLAAMNFQAKFFYFVFASFLFLVMLQGEIIFNTAMLPYLLLGVSMILYNSDEGILSILRCFAYVIFYIVGYNIVVTRGEKTNLLNGQKAINSVMLAISIGSFTHYFLNFLNNWDNIVSRNTIDVWSGEVMAATSQALLVCLMLGWSVSAIFLPIRKVDRWIGIVCIFVAFGYNLILAGRTLILLFMVVFLIGLFYFYQTVENRTIRFKVSVNMMFLFLVIVFLISSNVGGIQEELFESNLFERFATGEGSVWDDSRLETKQYFIINAWKYPFGGFHMGREQGYAHDLLLDGYDEYGLGVFLLLLVILIRGITSGYKFIKHTLYAKEIKSCFLCIYCVILLVFTVEPILQGMNWLFTCFALLNGCIEGLLLLNEEGEKYEDIANKYSIW